MSGQTYGSALFESTPAGKDRFILARIDAMRIEAMKQEQADVHIFAGDELLMNN
jgi:hypothetical protein